MAKITGLDKLSKQLKEAQKAFSGLDGQLGTVQFDPSDPGSIEAAIHKAESLVDERVGPYQNNPIVGPMAQQVKNSFREAIVARAAAARLEGEAE